VRSTGISTISRDAAGRPSLDLELTDKIAIVTGSSRGLGLASAQALAREGCRVGLCARGEEALRHAADQIRADAGADRIVTVPADVATAAGVQQVIDTVVAAFGGLDILVNNVGMGRGAGLLDTPDDVWQEAVDQTLFPAIRASRLAVPHMRRRGGGVIIMIASIFGRESGGRMTYNAVKAAEISLGKSMARELAGDNIRVNSVAPGSILFPGGSWHQRRQADPEGIAQFVRTELPFGRFGRPEEVGGVVAFLASARASWISGASVTVDGCQSRSLF
jgi:3-oxoacyl-[acyl-carrier protein] reductase